MTDMHCLPAQLPQRDWLLTRPSEEPLPTTVDPQQHGCEADPKRGQSDPQESNPAPDDIGRTA